MTATLSTTIANLAYDLDGVVGCTPEQIAAMDAEAGGRGLVRVAAGVYVTKETAGQKTIAKWDQPNTSFWMNGERHYFGGSWKTTKVQGVLMDHHGQRIGSFAIMPDANNNGETDSIVIGDEDHDGQECDLTESEIMQGLWPLFPEADYVAAEHPEPVDLATVAYDDIRAAVMALATKHAAANVHDVVSAERIADDDETTDDQIAMLAGDELAATVRTVIADSQWLGDRDDSFVTLAIAALPHVEVVDADGDVCGVPTPARIFANAYRTWCTRYVEGELARLADAAIADPAQMKIATERITGEYLSERIVASADRLTGPSAVVAITAEEADPLAEGALRVVATALVRDHQAASDYLRAPGREQMAARFAAAICPMLLLVQDAKDRETITRLAA